MPHLEVPQIGQEANSTRPVASFSKGALIFSPTQTLGAPQVHAGPYYFLNILQGLFHKGVHFSEHRLQGRYKFTRGIIFSQYRGFHKFCAQSKAKSAFSSRAQGYF